MSVENPEFHGKGAVYCVDCPLIPFTIMCKEWRDTNGGLCPDRNTYQSACLMAEEAKGGKE